MTTKTTTVPPLHKLACECDACYSEFRARWASLSEEQARDVFHAGAAAIRKQLANRPGVER